MLVGTKRERLLDWIRNGDPNDIPVLLGPGPEMAAAYYHKAAAMVTPAEVIQVAELTGTHNIACLLGAVVAPVPGIKMAEKSEFLPNKSRKITTNIATPAGSLQAVQIISAEFGEYWEKHLVESDADFPALVCLWEKMREAVKTEAVQARLRQYFREAQEPFGSTLPTLTGMTPPAMTLMINPYMDKELAILTVYDKPQMMEYLMDCVWQVEQQKLAAAAANDIDIYRIAVNGFEWLSPDLYERYMIPQTRRIAEFASAQGKLSWVHTCGKLKNIAKIGAYQKMGVNVVESLSAPPTGDIDDLGKTRREIGPDITTRGGINNELFYAQDLQPLRQQIEQVIDATDGFRHILGDTNPPAPPYSWESVELVINAVRARGRIYE